MLRPFALLGASALLVLGCASGGGISQPMLAAALADTSYGYIPDNPIQVGGGFERGPRNEREFLRSLRGPEGQPVTFRRLGSCCAHGSPPSLLDMYEVTYPGLATPVLLYLDMYVKRTVRAPKGFTRPHDRDRSAQASGIRPRQPHSASHRVPLAGRMPMS